MNYESTQVSELATRFVNSTNQCIFLTGKAGTGKTTFLRNIVKNTHKQTVIAAPTGIAAINAGGVTLHSLFQLPFGSFVPEEIQFTDSDALFSLNTPKSLMKEFQMFSNKRNMIRAMELLIIDEVSMLRADLLDAIDIILRHVRRQKDVVFGGVQILFIGDLLQLPPVVKDREWSVLRRFYASPFFFEARALQQQKPIYIELDKVFRQSDQHFINILNHFRENKVNKEDIDELNKHFQADADRKMEKGIIHLTTHNYKADKINKEELERLKGKAFEYKAEKTGDFNENNYPIEENLILKVGAQIMFIKNDPSGEQKFFNGKIAQIAELRSDSIEVVFPEDGTSFSIDKYTWENKKYTLIANTNEIEEKIVGTFVHYPIKLAWAITVHKSQGLTFERAIIDVNAAFAQGQVYVALSRLTSLDGLILSSHINYESLGLDRNVQQFSEQKESIDQLEDKYKVESHNYIRKFILNAFDLGALKNVLRDFIYSYNKEENRSVKQKHLGWAKKLDSELDELVDVAAKFSKQLNFLTHNLSNEKYEKLKERAVAAQNYFAPLLKEKSKNIVQHIKNLESEKGTKQYVTELNALEVQFFAQNQKISKALALIDAVINNKSLNEKLQTTELEERKLAAPEKKSKEKKQKSGTKEPKIPTREITYGLLKEGKSIEEIVEIRQLKRSTLLNHLSFYVETGELKASNFVAAEKIEEILKVRDKLDVLNMSPIKTELGDKFTYEEIGMALADYKSRNKAAEEK